MIINKKVYLTQYFSSEELVELRKEFDYGGFSNGIDCICPGYKEHNFHGCKYRVQPRYCINKNIRDHYGIEVLTCPFEDLDRLKKMSQK